MSKVDKSRLDVSAIFLTFMATVGCVERTALAMDVDPAIVQALAEQEGWIEKLRRVSLLSKSDKPGDHERAVNRALNFCAGHLLRGLIQKVLDALAKQDGAGLLATLASSKAGQVTYSAKLFSDLSSALEKATHITYVAMSDSIPEREGPDAEVENMSMSMVHASVLSALNQVGVAGAERQLLEDSVEDLVKSKIPPKKTDIET